MASEIDPRYTDIRTADRYKRRGLLSEKDHEKYLKQLPDLSAEADVIALEQPTSDAAPTR